MSYSAPLKEVKFLLEHVLDFNALAPSYKEADLDTIMMVITQAARLAEEKLAPLRRDVDLNPPRLEDGKVISAKGVGEVIAAIAEAGIAGISAPEEYGGLALPLIAQIAANEFLGSANLSLQLCPLLTQGQIEAIHAHGDEEQKANILPRLVSGEWTGTMLLTEAQAGSDVGALKSKASRNNDDSFSLSGQKIFISWGEHEHAKNISHLVLARLPDAPDGVKGISLFFVPKFLEDGTRNKIEAIALEEKLGLHGSPTCVMQMDGAKGWLVGEENAGLAAMFTMMNNARLNVGVQGLAIAEAALQDAAEFARERVQGSPRRSAGDHGTIMDHPDIRRMLMIMKERVYVARALALDCALAIDLGQSSPEQAARAGVLTPLAKSYGSDVGCENAHDCVQVFGGAGYVEETGVAQYYRDVRVTSIYEGTNGIQALDLVGRKMADKGEAVRAVIDGLEVPDEALAALKAATEALLARAQAERAGDAVDYQRGFAGVLGAHYLGRGAKHDRRIKALFDDYSARTLPLEIARLKSIADAPRELFALTPEEF